MDIIKNNKEISINCQTFNFKYRFNDIFFKVKFSSFTQLFFIPSSCDTIENLDLNLYQTDLKFKENLDNFEINIYYKSTIWNKIYIIRIYENYISYSYKLLGCGNITEMHFFEGIWEKGFEHDCYLTKHFNDNKKTVYQEYSTKSPVRFKYIFSPEPNSYNKQIIPYFNNAIIGANSDLDMYGGNFVANPGIFSFLITKNKKEWVTLGLSVAPKNNLFSEFEFFGGEGFGLNLNYWGLTQSKGIYTSPEIIILPQPSIHFALKEYINILKKNHKVPISMGKRSVSWWNKPIICGWGYQSYLGDLFRIRSDRPKDEMVYNSCTQDNYEKFINIVDNLDLPWGTLIIDARWYKDNSILLPDKEKWPNMKLFIDRLHNQGKKVLLWWGIWNPMGFKNNELITFNSINNSWLHNRDGRFAKFGKLSDGSYLAPDITLDSVQQKLISRFSNLLSNKGIDIDGFKLDHIASLPALYGIQFPDNSAKISGIELLKYYYDFIYKETKKIKKDALIIGQSPNPYFSNSFDMLRLGDIYSKKKNSVLQEMIFRKEMAKIACDDWLIDCDGWPLPSKKAAMEYLYEQTNIGVPSLYYTNNLDTTLEEIPVSYFSLLKNKWLKYINNKKNE